MWDMKWDMYVFVSVMIELFALCVLSHGQV
jgi:hypothetical protein